MATILALALLALAAVAGWGAARAAWPAAGRDGFAVGVTALALSVGVLTQVMLWVALLFPGRLGPGSAFTALAVAVAAGALLRRGGLRSAGEPAPRGKGEPARAPLAIVIAVPVVCAAILLGAALWPFRAGDALAVYGPLGRAIAATGALPVGERLYEAYPMLVPMLFAAIEWLVGRPDEYLSRLATAVLAVGAVAGAGWLARELRSVRAGWLAAALLAACPVYCGWATSGYADIPAGFFVVLAAVFAWRWWRGRALADALLGGAAAGLALWTKNSTLTLLVSGPALVAAWWWADRAGGRRQDGGAAAAPWRWSHIAAAAATTVAVAAPFYVRNVAVFGLAVPATVWSDRARRDLAGLLDPLRPGRGFGLLGWVATAAVLVCLGRIVGRRGAAPAEGLLVSLLVPFVGAWWWWASYDPRFLVTLLPVAAGFAGWLLDEAMQRLEETRHRRARWATALIVAGALLGTPVAVRRAVEHKWALLGTPWMSDLERHRLQVGGLFELGRAIGRLPAGARVGGVPAMARYYLEQERLPLVAWVSPQDAPCAAGFAYRVLAASPQADATPAPCPGRVVFRTGDGYEIVQVPTARGAGEVDER